ncbi:tripartite tricarboxylate transporter TctB family protein [Taklimakanibacter lacteus]|uniref:tripartite tricarboxylate transporter TctB family protein n=1 Tax=Taklimakanibacter lacteus TaxID=2268456 RepID=UPI000E663FFD
MKIIHIDTTNGLCGALFVVLGLFFAYQSWMMDMGTALRMGPGYFPLLLAGILLLLGIIVLIQATRVASEPIGPLAWRGMLLILPAPIFFGLTVRGLGFLPAIFITALIASFASMRMKPITALILSAGVTLFSYLVFSRGLSLPYRPFGPWLGF